MMRKTFCCVCLFVLSLLAGVIQAEAQTGQTCGGIGGLQCPTGLGCKYPEGKCDVADLAGTCVAIPRCGSDAPKICGCDGVTYANECELLNAGAKPRHQGACKKDNSGSKVCKSNEDCQGTEFCEFKEGTCGERGSGRCLARPEICTRIFSPVCGCDNKTYGNDCERQAAGVSLRAKGECPKPAMP
jgi:hypothetical protein